jgi:pimeloyl-ACP methyl ester carboxylesterase
MDILHYKELGEGEPVIILHGLLGMLDNWKTFARHLSKDYWVILVDQRNHGKSFHSEDFDYSLMAEDLRRLMAELYMPTAHLLGHSMGGKTVMRFAELYPEQVDKAVVVDIAPSGSIGSHSLIFESLLEVSLDKISERSEVEEQLVSKGIERDVVLFLMKNLKRSKESGGFEWKANISVLWNNYQNILASVVPAEPIGSDFLFVAGGKSKYISEEDKPLMAQFFPEYRLEVVEGAGHWVHAEKPKELLELVKGFID